MKKVLSFVLILCLGISCNPSIFNAYAETHTKAHWLHSLVDDDFYTRTSKILEKKEGDLINLDKNITISEFKSLLTKELGSKLQNIDAVDLQNGDLERTDAVKIIYELLNINKELNADKFTGALSYKFTDIETLPSHSRNAIAFSYNAKLINGYSEESFMPNKKMTVAEALTVINRLQKRLSLGNNTEIPFIVKSTKNTYEKTNEVIQTKNSNGKVLITLIRKLNDASSKLEILSISKLLEKEYQIQCKLVPMDDYGLQVINYTTIEIEIESKYLDKDSEFTVKINQSHNSGSGKLQQ